MISILMISDSWDMNRFSFPHHPIQIPTIMSIHPKRIR
jgi:hypothetical protein